MMWFDFIKWRLHFIRGPFHYSECIKYCQKYSIQNRISPETHNWYVHATWEIEPPNLGFTQMTSQGGVIKIFCLSLHLYAFWNNLWSVYRYITRQISGCWSQDGTSQQHLTAPIGICMSGIGDHRFTYLMDLLSNYTLYTNLTIFSISILLIEDVTSLIVFRLAQCYNKSGSIILRVECSRYDRVRVANLSPPPSLEWVIMKIQLVISKSHSMNDKHILLPVVLLP